VLIEVQKVLQRIAWWKDFDSSRCHRSDRSDCWTG